MRAKGRTNLTLPAWVGIVLLISIVIRSVNAQTASTGALSGTVTDASGAVIPNAMVTITSADTGQVHTASTNASGQYQFALLPPGDYKIRFVAVGFKSTEIASFKINVTEAPVVDRSLEVGGQAEQVTIEANVETIQATTSALGTIVAGQTATALPLTTRNYTNLLGLSAGANASVPNATGLGKGGVDIAVNGGSTIENNFSMDGVSITSSGSGSVVEGFYVGMAIPNPDTLQEFKIQTSLYDAGYGRNPGANVNVVTRSGTNSLHGTAFEFFRNTDLNANDFFRNRTCGVTPKICAGTGVSQVLNQNQFGGQLGGPIKKDRLFVFGAYQQTWQKNGAAAAGFSSGITLMPIPAGDRGTTGFGGGVNGLGDDAVAAAFRQALGAAFCPQNNPLGGKTNPGGGGLGTGMQVACDGSNISPYAMRYLQAKANGNYYIPGSGITPSLTNSGYLPGVAYSIPAYYREYQGMLNLDYLINSKNTLSSRYFRSLAPENIPFLVNGSFPGDPGTSQYGYQTGLLKLTTVVSQSVVNELRGSILRSVDDLFQSLPPGMAANNIYPNCNTLAAGSPLACAPTGHGILGGTTAAPPQIAIQGLFSSFGAGSNDVLHHQTTFGVGDQLSWTKGKHTIRVGGDWEDIRWTWVGSWLSHGIMAFQTFPDFLIGLPGACGAAALPSAGNPLGCNGSAYSNVLNTSNFDVRTGAGGLVHGYRMKNTDWFVQDDFRVTSRLTLNLGLRWEYDGQLSDKYGNAVNLWPGAAAAVPVPATTQIPTPGVQFFPQGGTFAGWVVPSNYDTKTWGTPPAGVITSGHIIATQNEVPKDDFAPRVGFAWQPTTSNRLVLRGGFGFFFDRVPGNTIVHAVEQSPPYGPTLDQGTSTNQFSSLATPFENLQPGSFPMRWVNFATNQGSDITEASEAQTMLTPLIYSWNLDVQYEFKPTWVLQLGYVGSHGIHLAQTLHITNEAAVASAANPVNGVTTNAVLNGSTYSSNARLRVPILGLSPTGAQYADTVGAEKFNSFQATLRKHLSHGLTLDAAYTFSRAFTNVPSVFNDPLNLRAQYGLNTAYRPQRLTIDYSWDIPTGHLTGVASKLLGGWNLSGITTIQDGQPLLITDTRGGAIYGLSGANPLVQSSAEIAAGKTYAQLASPGPISQRLGGASGGCGYFNCGANSPFTTIPSVDPTLPASVGSGWGNMGIGPILGPGQFNFDVTVIKNTRVGGVHENGLLQFRAEFFNIMNHPQFGNPASNTPAVSNVASNLALPNFGQITALSVNPRLVQLALKYIF